MVFDNLTFSASNTSIIVYPTVVYAILVFDVNKFRMSRARVCTREPYIIIFLIFILNHSVHIADLETIEHLTNREDTQRHCRRLN